MLGVILADFIDVEVFFGEEDLYPHKAGPMGRPLYMEVSKDWGDYSDVIYFLEDTRNSFLSDYVVFWNYFFPFIYILLNWLIFALWAVLRNKVFVNKLGFHPYFQHTVGNLDSIDKQRFIFVRKLRWLLRHQPWKAEAFLRLYSSEVATLFSDFEEFGAYSVQFDGSRYEKEDRELRTLEFLETLEQADTLPKDLGPENLRPDEDDSYWTYEVLNNFPKFLDYEQTEGDRDYFISYPEEVQMQNKFNLSRYIFWRYKFLLLWAYSRKYPNKVSAEFRSFSSALSLTDGFVLNEKYKRMYYPAAQSFLSVPFWSKDVYYLDKTFLGDFEQDVEFEDTIGGDLSLLEPVPRDFQFDPFFERLVEQDLFGFSSSSFLEWKRTVDSFLENSEKISVHLRDSRVFFVNSLASFYKFRTVAAFPLVFAHEEFLQRNAFSVSGSSENVKQWGIFMAAMSLSGQLGFVSGSKDAYEVSKYDYRNLGALSAFSNIYGKSGLERDFVVDSFLATWAFFRSASWRKVDELFFSLFYGLHRTYYEEMSSKGSSLIFYDGVVQSFVVWLPLLRQKGIISFDEARSLSSRFPDFSSSLVEFLRLSVNTDKYPMYFFERARAEYASLFLLNTEDVDTIFDYYGFLRSRTIRVEYQHEYLDRVKLVKGSTFSSVYRPYPLEAEKQFSHDYLIQDFEGILEKNETFNRGLVSKLDSKLLKFLRVPLYDWEEFAYDGEDLERSDFYRDSDVLYIYTQFFRSNLGYNIEKEGFDNSLGLWCEQLLRGSQKENSVGGIEQLCQIYPHIYNFVHSRLVFLSAFMPGHISYGLCVGNFDVLKNDTFAGSIFTFGEANERQEAVFVSNNDLRVFLPQAFNHGVALAFLARYDQISNGLTNVFGEAAFRYLKKSNLDEIRLIYAPTVFTSSWGFNQHSDYAGARVWNSFFSGIDDEVDTI
jgi:hypothetical protein